MEINNKAEIRKEARRRVLAMSPREREAASGEIARRVFQLESWQWARVVMAYMSLPTEPDTGEILREAERRGKTILLPRCGKKPEMEAWPWRGEAWMEQGPFGLREPIPEKDGGAEPQPEPELILVPCVAATKEGIRLGHGAGYYDWYLKRHPAEKVCLCFRQQLMESLPADPWDIPMDKVIFA